MTANRRPQCAGIASPASAQLLRSYPPDKRHVVVATYFAVPAERSPTPPCRCSTQWWAAFYPAELVEERAPGAEVLPEGVRAAGCNGSARNFRRLVAKATAAWRRDRRRGRRPRVWTSGDMRVIDW